MKNHIFLTVESRGSVLFPLTSMQVWPPAKEGGRISIAYTHEPYECRAVEVMETMDQVVALIESSERGEVEG